VLTARKLFRGKLARLVKAPRTTIITPESIRRYSTEVLASHIIRGLGDGVYIEPNGRSKNKLKEWFDAGRRISLLYKDIDGLGMK
jgi:hypothetical protein